MAHADSLLIGTKLHEHLDIARALLGNYMLREESTRRQLAEAELRVTVLRAKHDEIADVRVALQDFVESHTKMEAPQSK